MPIHSTKRDPGFFGPGSVTWEVHKEPLLILGGACALLLQAAAPGVAQGAIDHSNYTADPWGRLERTVDWVITSAYGTTDEVTAATGRIQRMHRHVNGEIPLGSGTIAADSGSEYAALNPELQRWVLATLMWTTVRAHDLLVGTLSPAQRDGYVAEWLSIAPFLSVPTQGWWANWHELDTYVVSAFAQGRIGVGAGARQIAHDLTTSPVRAIPQPMWELTAQMSCLLLPKDLRAAYELSPSPAVDRTLRGALSLFRLGRRATPAALRSNTPYQFAVARCKGEIPKWSAKGGKGRGVHVA